MSYRDIQRRITDAAGAGMNRLRALLSRREIVNEDSTGDRVSVIGREAADGSSETAECDAFGPVGVIGRPADDAVVEAAVAYVGADGSHPLALAFLDSSRRAVIDADGLGVDETVVYNSSSVIKILADGTVEIRSIGGTAQELAYKADADALNARIASLEAQLNTALAVLNGNVAVYNALNPPHAVPMVVVTPVSTTATVNGTTTLRGE